jgi:hypothetical protein
MEKSVADVDQLILKEGKHKIASGNHQNKSHGLRRLLLVPIPSIPILPLSVVHDRFIGQVIVLWIDWLGWRWLCHLQIPSRLLTTVDDLILI